MSLVINALALLIKYRPASSTSESDWRYVTDGTSDRVRRGLLEDTTRAYVRDEYGLDYDDLTESQQKLYTKEAESILENYDLQHFFLQMTAVHLSAVAV